MTSAAAKQHDRIVRLGAGAGFARDRIEPAVALARDGNLDYLIFECLAERTIALAQQQKEHYPELGYDPMLADRLRAVLPQQREKGFRIITNMGAANPLAAGRLALAIARELAITGLKIAVLEGDDVLEQIRTLDTCFLETGEPLAARRESLIAANAYLGAAGIRDALACGAQLVICGRVSDPALFLGPLVHEFGWAMDDWDRLGFGTLVGHMLECAGQVCGGYFADPGRKNVNALARLGFPIGEVRANGELIITKLPGTGGCVSAATCKEQLLYELHDPSAYLQPDVTADFSSVRITELAPDRVRLSGARGLPKPADLKVSVAYREDYVADGQISYGGTAAIERARLAADIVRMRLADMAIPVQAWQADLIGVDALYGATSTTRNSEPAEVRLRIAARVASLALADAVLREIEALYTNGPAGGGGITVTAREVVAVQSILLAQDQARSNVTLMEN